MPKAKPDRVVIHRIEFQDKERELLEAFIATQAVGNIGTILDGLGVDDFVREVSKMLDDPTRVLQVAYSIATILEMFGWESRWPTAVDFVDWFMEKDAKMEVIAANREANDYPDGVAKQIVDMFRNLLGMPYKPYDYWIFNEAKDGTPATPFWTDTPPDAPTPPGGGSWEDEFGEGGTQ